MSAKTHPGGEVWNAAASMLAYAEPAARIERLQRHAALRERSDKLLARYLAAGKRADARLLHDIVQAELHAERMDTAPRLERHARLGAPGRPRAKRADELDEWVAHDVARHAGTNDARWERAPRWVRLTSRSGFDKRITAAKKKIKSDNNL